VIDAELMSMSGPGDDFLDALGKMTISDAIAEMERVNDEWDKRLFARAILEVNDNEILGGNNGG